MPDPVTGVVAGASVIGGVSQSKANKKATRAQQQAADQSIAEQRRQFDAMQALLLPYVQAGGPALQGLMDLAGLSPVQTNWTAYAQANPELMAAFQAQQQPMGVTPQQGGVGAPYGLGEGFISGTDFLGGYNPALAGDMGLRGGMFAENAPMGGMMPGVISGYGGGTFDISGRQVTPSGPMSLEQFAQQYYAQNGGDLSAFQDNPQARAVAQIEGQPMFQAIARQGEEAILQNASATGGLRGGNTQGALARFRPELLNQFINQQYGRLAGLTELGQNAAAGVGSAGLSTGANIGNVLMSRGQATAAGAGAQGQIIANTIGNLGGIFAGGIRPGGPSAGLVGSVNSAFGANPSIF